MKIWAALIPAVLTGIFCAVFATAIDQIFDMVSMVQVAVISFCSGFLGSLFARICLRNDK